MNNFDLHIFLVILALTATSLYAYPRIQSLDVNDPLYVQQQAGVSRYFKDRVQNQSNEPLQLYEYIPHSRDTLMRIASRVLLPFGTIASFNNISQVHEPLDGKIIVIPNKPGIFIPNERQNVLQRMLANRIANTDISSEQITITVEEERTIGLFYEDVGLTAFERSRFLRSLFSFPLRIMRITSHFGLRKHPIEGYEHHHNGIDLGAPEGTPVYSPKDGIIVSIETDSRLGLVITMEHEFGYLTRYGHLQETLVDVGDIVEEGETIARVGNSGVSTGPHLHFEVQNEEIYVDPLLLLPRYGIIQGL